MRIQFISIKSDGDEEQEEELFPRCIKIAWMYIKNSTWTWL